VVPWTCEAGDWFTCSRELDGVLGVENAPVEVFWRRSNSSCSFVGRRGGEGPVAKAGRRVEVVNVREY